MGKSIPKTVYHYCDMNAFYSIIRSSSLRMSNISKSNDYAEISYCFEAFNKALMNACHDYASEYIQDEETIEFFEHINYDLLVSRAVRNNSLIYYAVCFSSEYDRLSQWCEYANDGKGVAIGFDTIHMLNAKEYTHIKFDRINYNVLSDEYYLYNHIKEKLVQIKNGNSKKTNYSEYENAINGFVSGMVYNAVFYKNPAFKEEKEWRLVYYPFGRIRNLVSPDLVKEPYENQIFYDRMKEDFEYEKNYYGLKRGKIEFKNKENMLISYIDLNYDKIKKSLIKEIIIGPKSKADDRDLRLFLLSNGYNLDNITIRKSSASYR